MSAALDRLGRNEFDLAKGTPLNVFLLSDGQITWGDADATALLARFEILDHTPGRLVLATVPGERNLREPAIEV